MSFLSQINDFSQDQVTKYRSNYENGKEVGHYTQMVWGETDSIGCAMALKPDKKKMVMPNRFKRFLVMTF